MTCCGSMGATCGTVPHEPAAAAVALAVVLPVALAGPVAAAVPDDDALLHAPRARMQATAPAPAIAERAAPSPMRAWLSFQDIDAPSAKTDAAMTQSTAM